MTNDKAETILGYKFKDAALLKRAVTHRSWAHERMNGEDERSVREAQNESLEFVGDSVLGLAVAEHLFRAHPDASEGDLTLMKHRLVSTNTLSRIARELGLGEHLRVGRGEERSGGRRKGAILADTLEALIGAVFFDGGYAAAKKLVERLFGDELGNVTPESSVDYKTLLQETLQAEKLSAPVYSVVRTEGQPHARTFFVRAEWEAGKAEGKGPSIKAAEMMAASQALKLLKKKPANGLCRPRS